MVQTNLFPAILVAGAPNCGKSVLSFLLTQHLRARGIAHYLLRTAPDGEGDWFQAGGFDLVRQIRMEHKRAYTPELVRHMCSAIHNRALPMLVDIGGKPRGDQLEILQTCTHSILLYRTQAEKAEWQGLLAEMNLLPVAELRSDLNGQDAVSSDDLVFQATIASLERDPERRQSGPAFEQLARLVAGICFYDSTYLEAEHARRAPYPLLLERDLANALGVRSDGENKIWQPTDLARLAEQVQPGQPMALYGRGPVWLAAALAVLARQSDMALFDARYGWVPLSQIQAAPNERVQFEQLPYPGRPETGGSWLEVRLNGNTLEPDKAPLPLLNESGGLVLSGKLPRWYFAALARCLAPGRPWLATYVPAIDRAVVVASSMAQMPVGTLLPGKVG